MGIVHHPDEATLMSFAAGTLPEALSAVVATHLMICPDCRQTVRGMELLGAVLMQDAVAASQATSDGRAAQMPAPAVTGVSQEDPAEAGDLQESHDALDAALIRLTGSPLNEIRWKRLGLGVMHYPIPMRGADSGDLRLIKVAKGHAMPEHGHGASELTLVLHGAYSDELGTFRAGDLADLADDVEHRPIADPVSGCICLIASERRARFTGVVGRILQPLAGI